MKKTIEERFWAKVEIIPEHPCWEWIGTKKDGYGRMFPDLRAHRVSWELHFGQIPNALVVRHDCDNRPCVRPDHLRLGTTQDNTADRTKRNRQAKGEKQGSARLTEAQVLEIRELAKSQNCSQIAKIYGVHRSHAWAIVTGVKWSYL
jgi:hypothetical protein